MIGITQINQSHSVKIRLKIKIFFIKKWKQWIILEKNFLASNKQINKNEMK